MDFDGSWWILVDFELIFASYPHIGRQIFSCMDLETLVKNRLVCKSWKIFLDDEMARYICSKLSERCSILSERCLEKIPGCISISNPDFGKQLREVWTKFLQEIKGMCPMSRLHYLESIWLQFTWVDPWGFFAQFWNFNIFRLFWITLLFKQVIILGCLF